MRTSDQISVIIVQDSNLASTSKKRAGHTYKYVFIDREVERDIG